MKPKVVRPFDLSIENCGVKTPIFPLLGEKKRLESIRIRVASSCCINLSFSEIVAVDFCIVH